MEAATCCNGIQFCLARAGSSHDGSSARFRLLYALERTSDAETTVNWDKFRLCVFNLTRSVPADGICYICGVNSSCVACYPGSRATQVEKVTEPRPVDKGSSQIDCSTLHMYCEITTAHGERSIVPESTVHDCLLATVFQTGLGIHGPYHVADPVHESTNTVFSEGPASYYCCDSRAAISHPPCTIACAP